MLTTIYKDETGNIVAVKLASENESEAHDLIGVADKYASEAPGSGSERWGASDWTGVGDGTTYPVVLPTQAEADAAAVEPVI